MIKTKFKLFAICGIFMFLNRTTHAQTTPPKPTAVLWDGMIVAGYVNNGAFVNFGGPAIKWTQKPFSLMLGMLPSLRIKEEKVPGNATKNTTLTPSLGCGLSAAYKHFVVQVPLYYNAKTQTADGKWNVGVGVGYKF